MSFDVGRGEPRIADKGGRRTAIKSAAVANGRAYVGDKVRWIGGGRIETVMRFKPDKMNGLQVLTEHSHHDVGIPARCCEVVSHKEGSEMTKVEIKITLVQEVYVPDELAQNPEQLRGVLHAQGRLSFHFGDSTIVKRTDAFDDTWRIRVIKDE